MRILVCHSRYRSGPASGENRVVDDEIRLLLGAGHQVIRFTPSPEVFTAAELVKIGVGMIWNRRVLAKLRVLIDAQRPEIVHFHNIFPLLSPASLRLAGGVTPGVVMTLHNYRLLCLPGTFVRDGAICELCLGRAPWQGVRYQCYQGSLLASATLATSLSVHRALGTFDRVDRFIAVSRFVKEKHVAAGLLADRIVVKPHFVWPNELREGSGRYFLYLGRLSEEKGVDILLRAWDRLLGRLIIAGVGPDEMSLRANAGADVEFVGSVSPRKAAELVRGATGVVVPSIGQEGAGRVVLEAYAAGVPVVATNIGGLSEVVVHGTSGLLVDPSDEMALSDAIGRLSDPPENRRLGKGAYRLWRERYSPERALGHLETAYEQALHHRQTRSDRG